MMYDGRPRWVATTLHWWPPLQSSHGSQITIRNQITYDTHKMMGGRVVQCSSTLPDITKILEPW